MVWRCFVPVLLVLCATAFAASPSNHPKQFYIVAEAYSDAAPFWFGYILDVRPDGTGWRLRWIRVRKLVAGCPPPVTVQLAEKHVTEKSITDLLRRANPCKTTTSQVERAYRQRKRPDLMDHPVHFGIVAACADGEIAHYLPQFEWEQERKLKRRANQVWRLRNLYSDVLLKTFGEKGPFWDITDEEDFQLQVGAESVVGDLRNGTFDGGLQPCREPDCKRSWSEILNAYRGPVRLSEVGPKAELRVEEYMPAGLRFLDFVGPVYPPLARQARIQGTVRLELDYNRESGEITDVKATSGHPLLTPAAVAAARKWKLDAASTGGEPVSVSLEFSIGCP